MTFEDSYMIGTDLMVYHDDVIDDDDDDVDDDDDWMLFNHRIISGTNFFV
jgi:hypothetical protein